MPWNSVAAEEAVYLEHFHDTVRDAIVPVLAGMGYALVELALGRRKGATRVSVVIYRQEGVGVDDCAEVSGMLLPRLETIEGMMDVSLEVSSPGIERTLRGPTEYAIFVGRGVRVLAGAETEWRSGIIERVEGGMLWLKIGREHKGFALADIRKARLDDSVEVEEAKNAV
jgi:ribosome maturation factor RimP